MERKTIKWRGKHSNGEQNIEMESKILKWRGKHFNGSVVGHL
jgi:hypothetical protein